ncbi:MAG TPA: hypothetical protein PLM85_09005 [Nitrosomonas sp.]|nr:hypothetical protein [Nitrosomonas sp.]
MKIELVFSDQSLDGSKTNTIYLEVADNCDPDSIYPLAADGTKLTVLQRQLITENGRPTRVVLNVGGGQPTRATTNPNPTILGDPRKLNNPVMPRPIKRLRM